MNNTNQEATTSKTKLSQNYFNKVSLIFYDLILYGVISKYAWGSSIARLDSHYKKYVRSNHLEVGVGTGFLLNRVAFDSIQPRLALMDLSRDCLEKTKLKVSRYAPETYIQNLLEPIGYDIPQFESIGVNYVMHCVPGNLIEKSIAFSHLQPLLSKEGVLFGTTVLSEDVHKNLLAKPVMWFLNFLGIFNNRGDNARDLKNYFENNFHLIEFEVIGVTAFFAVKQPLRAAS